MDFPLFLIILSLLGLGLVSLFSASAIYASNKGLASLFYTKRQAIWMILGLGAAAGIARIDLERIRKFIKPGVILTVLLLGATLFMPPVAHVRRWIPLGFMKLQMSEFAKIVLVLYLADFFDRHLSHIASNPKQLLKPLGAMAIILALIAREPDLGTPALMFVTAIFMFFAAGVKLRFILMPIAAMIPVFIVELFLHPYRIARLKTFLSPWESASGAGYQLAQSLLAVGSGGWLGKGLGASQLKLMYLPEPHTDFIFSIIAEETGFIGSLLIVLLFLGLLIKGVRIARNAPSFYTSLTALGLTLMITLQSFFNMAMTMGLIPTKGIPLPFFSYGGSSILASMIAVGIILNISAHRNSGI
ncbi:MAG: cell division protein FtsW [Elusimicrobia bacterium RIFOXYA12_FULL_51_18]|nr:MAG: cell division protein FtsW [Elusimicrobia bacterium RIFOXYA12_FULL_51_18]OGS29628.1 MAG: cell division protein FtsW [Elusimicrobia bacterium RIFOXYA2_FULL_53_38]